MNQTCKSESILSDGFHDCILEENHLGKHVFSKIAYKESKWLVSSCKTSVLFIGRQFNRNEKHE